MPVIPWHMTLVFLLTQTLAVELKNPCMVFVNMMSRYFNKNEKLFICVISHDQLNNNSEKNRNMVNWNLHNHFPFDFAPDFCPFYSFFGVLLSSFLLDLFPDLVSLFYPSSFFSPPYYFFADFVYFFSVFSPFSAFSTFSAFYYFFSTFSTFYYFISGLFSSCF